METRTQKIDRIAAELRAGTYQCRWDNSVDMILRDLWLANEDWLSVYLTEISG